MTDNWKDKCSFLNPQTSGVGVDINGESITFYPVSVGKLFELRAVAQPLAGALMTLMSDTSNDSGVHRLTNEDGSFEESIMAPTPELTETRHKHQTVALAEMTEALTSPANLGIVGGILIDSLHDIFPSDGEGNPSGSEFISSLNAPDLPAFIKGLLQANKGALGELGGKTGGLLEAVIGKVKARAEEATNKEVRNKSPEEPQG